MTEECIRESELQEWFQKAARNRTVYDSIENLNAVHQRLTCLEKAGRVTDKTSRNGLANVLQICGILAEANHLVENKSIAPEGCSQMRPDLVLCSDGAHYLLVELKTQRGSERQGVQELLAYSAAIKMQMPYVNEFIYIIVANNWNTLLSYGVRSLVMDGKRVLPLQCNRRGNDDFTLSIRLDLFEFNFSLNYDPRYAMVPATLAVIRKVSSPSGALVNNYLHGVAIRAIRDCQHLNQSGFAVMWTTPYMDHLTEIANVTLITVNQHWLSSEHLPSDYLHPAKNNQDGLHGVLQQQANIRKQEVYRQETQVYPFTDSAANEAAECIYPQSTLSYEVIERHRNRDHEQYLRTRKSGLGMFESGMLQNLDAFIMELDNNLKPLTITNFWPFGEVEDFMRVFGRCPRNCDSLIELVDTFCQYKLTKLGNISS